MTSVTARNTSCTLIRVSNNIVFSAMSISVKVTSNLISAVLRQYIIILLTLKASYNAAFLRIDINVILLVV